MSDLNELAEEDVSMIKYFYFDKGDVTRWSGWEECKKKLEKTHPHILAAFNQLDIAERTVKALLEGL